MVGILEIKTIDGQRKTPYDTGFSKAGVSCLYGSEVLNSSYVHLMKFSAKIPRLR
jgi:hypothetical protein